MSPPAPPSLLWVPLLALGWCDSLSDPPGCAPISAQIDSETTTGSESSAASIAAATPTSTVASADTTTPSSTATTAESTVGESTTVDTPVDTGDSTQPVQTTADESTTAGDPCGDGDLDPGEICDPQDPNGTGGCNDACDPSELVLIDLAAGDDHVCALYNNNDLRCFDASNTNQPLMPPPPALPPEIAGPLDAVFAGGTTTCVTSAALDKSYCWNSADLEPTWIAGPYYPHIAINDESENEAVPCGVDPNVGELRCWGDHVATLFNKGVDCMDPIVGPIIEDVEAFTMGSAHACAIQADTGTVVCSGYDGGINISCGTGGEDRCCATACGECGVPCPTCQGVTAATTLSAWRDTTCALKPGLGATIKCWGAYGGDITPQFANCSGFTDTAAQVVVFGVPAPPEVAACVVADAGKSLCCRDNEGTTYNVADMEMTDTTVKMVGTAHNLFLLTSAGVIFKLEQQKLSEVPLP